LGGKGVANTSTRTADPGVKKSAPPPKPVPASPAASSQPIAAPPASKVTCRASPKTLSPVSSPAQNQNETPLDQETWRQVVAAVRQDNTGLASILSQSHPYISGKNFVVEVLYPFWEEKVRIAKNLHQLTTALKDVTKKEMKVVTRANGRLRKVQLDTVAKEEQEILNDVKSVFGG